MHFLYTALQKGSAVNRAPAPSFHPAPSLRGGGQRFSADSCLFFPVKRASLHLEPYAVHGVKGSPRGKLFISLSRLSFASWLAHTQAGSAEGRARPGRPAATDLEKEVGVGAGSCVVVSPSGSFSV